MSASLLRVSILCSSFLLLCAFGYADSNIRYTYRCDGGTMEVVLNMDKTIHVSKPNAKGLFTEGMGEAPPQPGMIDYQGKLTSLSTRRRNPVVLSVGTAFLNGKSKAMIRLDRVEYPDCKLN